MSFELGFVSRSEDIEERLDACRDRISDYMIESADDDDFAYFNDIFEASDLSRIEDVQQLMELICPPYIYFTEITESCCYCIDSESIRSDLANGTIKKVNEAPKNYEGLILGISEVGEWTLSIVYFDDNQECWVDELWSDEERDEAITVVAVLRD